MKKVIRNIGCLLLTVWMVSCFSSCNNEDDVIGLFTGKTWKLSFISAEGSHKQYDFWNGNSEARQKSMEALGKEGNFILNFEGTDLNGTAGGSFSGKAISATISGSWNANGESRELNLNNVKASQAESDALAKAFITGLQNAYRYEGDATNLFIYYKEGQTVKRLGLKSQQ